MTTDLTLLTEARELIEQALAESVSIVGASREHDKRILRVENKMCAARSKLKVLERMMQGAAVER